MKKSILSLVLIVLTVVIILYLLINENKKELMSLNIETKKDELFKKNEEKEIIFDYGKNCVINSIAKEENEKIKIKLTEIYCKGNNFKNLNIDEIYLNPEKNNGIYKIYSKTVINLPNGKDYIELSVNH